MKTLLLTTAGGSVAALLMAALGPWRDRIRIVGLNADAAAEPNFRCDAVYLVPPTAQAGPWRDRVRAIIRAESADLVLPTRDGDLVPLAGLIGDPACAGTRIFAPGPVSAATLVDKLASFRFAQARGLPFADSAGEPEEVKRLVARAGFPLIVKPRIGSGSEGVRVVRSWAEVTAHLAASEPVFQPFIGDRAILEDSSLDPVLGMPFQVAYGRRRNLSAVGVVLADRRVLYCGTIDLRFDGPTDSHAFRLDDPRIERMTRDLGTALASTDFLGFFNLQAITDADGSLVPIEYNGRLVGAARTRMILGLSEVPVILNLLLGEALPPMPQPPTGKFTSTVLMTEYVSDADVAALARDGVWRRNAGGGGGSVIGGPAS